MLNEGEETGLSRFACTVCRIAVSLGVVALFGTISFAADRASSKQLRDADNYFKFGSRALRAGNVRKARDYYAKALRVFPAFPEAHAGMGQIALGEGRFEDSLHEYERARDGYAEVGDALFDLEIGRYMEAQEQIRGLRDQIQELHRILASRPTLDPSSIEREITQLEASAQQLETIKPPVRGLPIEPPGELFFYLGNALFRLDRVDEALAAWETCVSMSPKFPPVYNNLAVAYFKKNRLHDALQSVARSERMGVPVNPGLKSDLERGMTRMAGALPGAHPD